MVVGYLICEEPGCGFESSDPDAADAHVEETGHRGHLQVRRDPDPSPA